MAGSLICKFTIQQYNHLLDILRSTSLPDELIVLILEFTPYNTKAINSWGLEPFTNFIDFKSKSGRKIKKPIRFSQQSFVSGRFDQYDSHYYHGISYDRYETKTEKPLITIDIDYNYFEEEIEEPDEPEYDTGSDFEPDEEDTDDEETDNELEDDCLD